jgi:2-iminoacetate synthase ThiH
MMKMAMQAGRTPRQRTTLYQTFLTPDAITA